jgi:hypothetical protein
MATGLGRLALAVGLVASGCVTVERHGPSIRGIQVDEQGRVVGLSQCFEDYHYEPVHGGGLALSHVSDAGCETVPPTVVRAAPPVLSPEGSPR